MKLQIRTACTAREYNMAVVIRDAKPGNGCLEVVLLYGILHLPDIRSCLFEGFLDLINLWRKRQQEMEKPFWLITHILSSLYSVCHYT